MLTSMTRSTTVTSSVHLSEELLAREDAVRFRQQFAQYFEFFTWQGHFGAVHGAALDRRLDRQTFERQYVGAGSRTAPRGGTAHDGADACQDCAERVRFGYVVVGPDVESAYHVLLRVLGSAEYDRHRLQRRIGFHDSGQLQARYIAHHDVEQYQAVARQVECQRLLGAERHIDGISFGFEIESQGLAQCLFVVNDKYSSAFHAAKLATNHHPRHAPASYLIKV